MPRQANGLYSLAPEELDSLLRAADRNGEHICQWSLAACVDKQALLAQMAQDLGFTADFGHNWDALADSLCDLDRQRLAPGLVLTFIHTATWRQRHPDDLTTLAAVLQDTCVYWQQRGRAFRVLMATF